jgi:hypothetical protein
MNQARYITLPTLIGPMTLSLDLISSYHPDSSYGTKIILKEKTDGKNLEVYSTCNIQRFDELYADIQDRSN